MLEMHPGMMSQATAVPQWKYRLTTGRQQLPGELCYPARGSMSPTLLSVLKLSLLCLKLKQTQCISVLLQPGFTECESKAVLH